jgi:arsenate reductase (thioredoxin)
MKLLILCTGNSCRSQMAAGFLAFFDPRLQVSSAGTHPESAVNPFAITVMKEIGIDISQSKPKNVDLFLEDSFDYVITVCDNARESCPYFTGKVDHRLHFGFEDPAKATGTEEERFAVYRKIRDQIRETFFNFYKEL